MVPNITDFFAYSYGGNNLREYLIALLVFLALITFFSLIRFVLYRQMRRRAVATETVIDDVIVTMLGALNPTFYSYLSFFCAVQTLRKPQWFENTLLVILLVWLSYECLSVVQEIIHDVSARYGDRKRNLKSAVALISILVSLVLWLVGGATILANLGIDPTTLLAGLGIGGIVVALAMQNILGDLFNYFSLRMDNPITEGDFVIIGDKGGNVTKIGIKTTRLRSLTGEEVIVSNKELLSNKLENYGKAEKRGAIFTLTFSPATPAKVLQEIPALIREHIEGHEKTEFIRSHLVKVTLLGFEVETYYKVHEHEFNLFCDTHQTILLEILEALEKKKCVLSVSQLVTNA